MSVKKMGSKLAQGVRQVMEQGKTPEVAEQEVARKLAAARVSESVSKSPPAIVANKTPVRSSDAKYEILHPERIWPD